MATGNPFVDAFGSDSEEDEILTTTTPVERHAALLGKYDIDADNKFFFLDGHPTRIAKIINATERPDNVHAINAKTKPLAACGGAKLTEGILTSTSAAAHPLFSRRDLTEATMRGISRP